MTDEEKLIEIRDRMLSAPSTTAAANFVQNHGSGSGMSEAQVDARVALGITGKADLSHSHDGAYQPVSSVLTGTTASFTAAQESKLAGIATGATANSTDATLLAFANHTGTALPAAVVTATGLRTSHFDIASSVAPITGATQTFNTQKRNETLALTHSATIAAQTLVFPSDANSQIGQVLRVYSRAIITLVTLTLNSNTIYGLNLTTLAVNGNAAWQKVAASTWVRIQ